MSEKSIIDSLLKESFEQRLVIQGPIIPGGRIEIVSVIKRKSCEY